MVINEKKVSILESENNKFTTDKLKRDELGLDYCSWW